MTRVLLLLLLAALPAGEAFALARPNTGDSLPPLRAERLQVPVSVDGALTEACWQAAPTARDFVQGDPYEGSAPSESTWVWMAFDEKALYVAARMWDSHPDSIVAQLIRRDGITASDRFFLMLDPFHDHRTGFFFTVNAAGVLRDGLLLNDTWADEYWDAVWEGRARRDARGWTVEMRIPFSQLRFRPGAEQVWGVNVRRRLERRSEEDYIVYTPKNGSGYVSRFPHLVGLTNGHHTQTVELVPYSTGKAEYLVHDPGDPFRGEGRYTPEVGADLRMGVGNNLTLNATVNPDFGQVEVDPAVVNLSDVESYFQEKRPFFTENAGLFRDFGQGGASNYWGFNWPGPTFFYTRRIGRAPQLGAPDGADFSDVPMATRILGAAKLTGKLTPTLSFGAVQAVTGREDARYMTGGLERRAAVEPLTYYGVARGLKEMRDGRDGLGAMTTLVQRNLDGRLADALNRQALVAGIDGWHFLDRNRVWVLSGWAAASRVAGTAADLTALQRSSRHYFQRPDADYLGVDEGATSLTGTAARVWLNKEKGPLVSNTGLGFINPRFDVNDMGFQSQSDLVNWHVGGGYKWTAPKGWRKLVEIDWSLYQTRDFDGVVNGQGLWLGSFGTFASDWGYTVTAAASPRTLNDRRTRGGPRMQNLPSTNFSFALNTNARDRLYYELMSEYGTSPDGRTHEMSFSPSVTWKPASNVTFSMGPGYSRLVQNAMYVGKVAAPGEVPADFGDRRYLFARLDQSEISAGIRLDVSFTPTLSLQTYLQPLISAGTYTGFKELARAGSYEFVEYGTTPGTSYVDGVVTPANGGTPFALADPSFNFKSLRGNAVLRWEYRPGSVLYFVWTQERTDFEPFGDLRLGSSTRRLLDAQGDDVFMVKATYYLGL